MIVLKIFITTIVIVLCSLVIFIVSASVMSEVFEEEDEP
jgi:hypothetical protein